MLEQQLEGRAPDKSSNGVECAMHGQSLTLAVVGVGHLASYTVTALRKAGFGGVIQLCPRGAVTADRLSKEQNCVVATSNQSALKRANFVLLAVRPEHAKGVLQALNFEPEQILLSAVSGISVQSLGMLTNAKTILRVMPSSFVEYGNSFVPMFPANVSVAALFGPRFPVIACETEHHFDDTMIMSCAYAWQFGLLDVLQSWFVERGWEEARVRDLLLKHWQGVVTTANSCESESFAQLLAGIGTEGTFTKLGFDAFTDAGGVDAQKSALDSVAQVLRAGDG